MELRTADLTPGTICHDITSEGVPYVLFIIGVEPTQQNSLEKLINRHFYYDVTYIYDCGIYQGRRHHSKVWQYDYENLLREVEGKFHETPEVSYDATP